jgi:hypothetical protein
MGGSALSRSCHRVEVCTAHHFVRFFFREIRVDESCVGKRPVFYPMESEDCNPAVAVFILNMMITSTVPVQLDYHTRKQKLQFCPALPASTGEGFRLIWSIIGESSSVASTLKCGKVEP